MRLDLPTSDWMLYNHWALLAEGYLWAFTVQSRGHINTSIAHNCVKRPHYAAEIMDEIPPATYIFLSSI